MRNHLFLFLVCVFFASLIATSSHACSTICLDKNSELVVGKNFDFVIGVGLIVVNKRNVSKTALLSPDWVLDQPARWTSKYGSITFNQWGREFAFSGMNELGLVVSVMDLGTTIYPSLDERPALAGRQWIQYQLDNSATVEQVLASDAELRITNNDTSKMHFMVCDRTGACAAIEFIDGELVSHTQKLLPVKALTNGTYEEAIEYWEKDEIPTPDLNRNITRFTTAANMLEDYDSEASGPAVDYIFNILSNMEWYMPTQWSIAYDIQNQIINFHTFENESLRNFDINSFNFSCLTPVQVLDVQEDLSGDVSGNFVDYTYEINRDLIETGHSVYDVREETLDDFAHYPDTTKCVGACEGDGDCDRGTCVNNVCATEGSMQIDKCTVKAGKDDKGDSIKLSGLLEASTADFNAAMGGNIIVTIEAVGIPGTDVTTHVFPIDEDSFNKGKYKSPKVKPANKNDPVTSLQIDAIKGKMKFSGKNLDLTGLSCPITLKIQIGDPVAAIVLNEDIVNGPKKPCPPELMMGI